MPSKVIASLDAWIQQVDDVLNEQHEAAISPSQVIGWDDTASEVRLTLTTFLRGLRGLLGRLCASPGRWILIVEDHGNPNHFWQALAYEDGSLITEVISNHFLKGDDRWTADQVEELVRLGWDVPLPPSSPNWRRVQSTTSPDVDREAGLAGDTLRQVFGIGDTDWVRVVQVGLPERGETPASPTYDHLDPHGLVHPRLTGGAERHGSRRGQRPVLGRPPEPDAGDEALDAWCRSFIRAALGRPTES